jgi:predicted nucleic acid-binding protein
MAVVDASVWIARFLKGDAFHDQARHIIRTLTSSGERISLPAIAFTEVAGAIKRITKNNNDAYEAVLDMKDLEPEVLVNFDVLEPIATEIAVKHSIKGADAYYIAVAKITKSHLYTFDEQQKEAFDAMSKTW